VTDIIAVAEVDIIIPDTLVTAQVPDQVLDQVHLPSPSRMEIEVVGIVVEGF